MKQAPLPDWPRAEVAASGQKILSRGSKWKPVVYQTESADGRQRVVKDCAALPWYSRGLARFLMGRERRLMRRVEGISGFPVVREKIDRNAFSMEVLKGSVLNADTFRLAPRRIADDLLQLVAKMHTRGVFHLDLRQRQNILLGPGLEVLVLDFGAGWAPNPVARRFFGKLLGEVDRSAALKYLAQFSPDDLTMEEAAEVLRGIRRRKMWILSPYRSRGIEEAVQKRLQDRS